MYAITEDEAETKNQGNKQIETSLKLHHSAIYILKNSIGFPGTLNLRSVCCTLVLLEYM